MKLQEAIGLRPVVFISHVHMTTNKFNRPRAHKLQGSKHWVRRRAGKLTNPPIPCFVITLFFHSDSPRTQGADRQVTELHTISTASHFRAAPSIPVAVGRKTPFVSDSAMCAPANTDIPNLEHVFSLYGLGSCANRAWHLQLYMICLHLSLSSALKHVCNPKTTQLQLLVGSKHRRGRIYGVQVYAVDKLAVLDVLNPGSSINPCGERA